jgi:hypothetical protein
LSVASEHGREDHCRCGEQYCALAGDSGHSRLYGGQLQTVAILAQLIEPLVHSVNPAQ